MEWYRNPCTDHAIGSSPRSNVIFFCLLMHLTHCLMSIHTAFWSSIMGRLFFAVAIWGDEQIPKAHDMSFSLLMLYLHSISS